MSNTSAKRVITPIDQWSIQERLALASAVLRSGDQNWASVSRMIKAYGEKDRPPEWFSQKNCARQYSYLLDQVEKPKRKRGGTETTGQSIVRNLSEERIKELKFLILKGRDEFIALSKELKDIESGGMDDNLSDYSDDTIKSDSDMESDISESSNTNRLPETKDGTPSIIFDEEKPLSAALKKPTDELPDLKEPPDLATVTEVLEDEIQPQTKPMSSTTSTPVKAPSTSPNVSPQLKNLVHTAIAEASEDDRPKTMSPTTGAPTLSMLLEMPPRDRGQPLPELPSFMGSPNKSPKVEKDIDPDINLTSAIKEPVLEDKTLKSPSVVVEEKIEEVSKDNDPETSKEFKVEASEISLLDSSHEMEAGIEMNDKQENEPSVVIITCSPVKIIDSEKEKTPEVESMEQPNESKCSTEVVDETKIKDSKALTEMEYPVEAMDESQDLPSLKVEVVDVPEDSTAEPVKESSLVETVTEPVQSEINKTAVEPVESESSEMVVKTKTDSCEKEQCNTDIYIENELAKLEEEVTRELLRIASSSDLEKEILSEAEKSLIGKSSPKKTENDKVEEIEKITALENVDSEIEKPLDDEEKSAMEECINNSKVKPDSIVEKKYESLHENENITEASVKDSPTDSKPNSSDPDHEHVEKAKPHYIGRGKKAFIVTIVENEKGEKVELKTADGASIKVTRNLSKETGLKIEDLPYSKKTSVTPKDKEETPVPTSPAKKKGNSRASNANEGTPKVSPKNLRSIPQSSGRQTGGAKKSGNKSENTEVNTPHLRSRGGPTHTPTPAMEDDNQVPSDSNVSTSESDGDKKEEPKINEDKKEADANQPLTKPVEEPLPETAKDRSAKNESDDSEDDLSDALSDESGKGSNSEGEADESDSSRKVHSKKGTKSRKDRLESAEMADDDSSNSANDPGRKRVTRRSVKVSPRKSESKLKNIEDKIQSRQRDRLSLPARDSKSENKTPRPSKALTRVKHLSEEATLIYGDLETQSGDGFATRVTRARAKTGSSAPTPNSHSKNVTPSSELETFGEIERKARSTRSRRTLVEDNASSALEAMSQCGVIDHLPPVSMDSNPSSPCSSTTNSTIIDEDKDQRAFRKSIMLVWNRIAAHKYSSLFLKPINEDKAPGYLEKVKRPMDLATIKRNVETGITRTFRTFERDVYLMFMNAMMFNPRDHEVSIMSGVMESDVRIILEDHQKMVKASLESGEAYTPISERMLRRDSRILFPTFDPPLQNRLSDSEPEMENIGEGKAKLSFGSSDRKRRADSNELDTPDTKKRKTRTSASSIKRIKPQVSPDIVSASYD